ncbi:PucR family transcriptional regulator [Aminipila butyrica]|uniref:PucR family transcriptional regulator n=1 Tax=Aminipila butyrica TaxID=433296 RepID=A0A858BU81_9FIRM|nr:PucR family transcriptional regulator [Aminipila butyrica]QIB69591.1 PucR family transcriptional regulator [Aminipila butyrica]
MIQIRELLKMPLFQSFKLIAGENGLNQQLSNVVILEYESVNNSYHVFNPGDFILTSLFFAVNDPESIVPALRNVINRRIAGIAIKTVFFEDVPLEIKKYAEEKQVPIFTFNEVYMEDLILCVSNFLKLKQHFLINENHINKLVHTVSSPELMQHVVKQINPLFFPHVTAAFITPKDEKSNIEFTSHFYELFYKNYNSAISAHYSYIKYQAGMLIIQTSPSAAPVDVSVFNTLLNSIKLDSSLFYIGISEQKSSYCDFHIAIKMAIWANQVGQMNHANITYYRDIGVYKWIAPLLNDSIITKDCQELIYKINEYDKSFKSNLWDTLIIFIKNNGEYAKTAKDLYQHPNTIRYRIKKIREITDLNDNDFYAQLYICVKLYLLSSRSDI